MAFNVTPGSSPVVFNIPSPHPSTCLTKHLILLLRSYLLNVKKHSFSAKSDTRALTTQRCVGLRRYKRGGTKFNTFARWVFLRLSRSCRVAEKSDPIDRFLGPDLPKIVRKIDVFISFLTTAYHQVPRSPIAIKAGGAPPPPHPPRLTKHFYCFDLRSREPKNTVFQQNPIVVQAELDAPLDSDALNAAAQSSIHLLKVFFSVCRDLVALRRNPIRSAPKSQIVLFFSKSRQSCTHSSTLRWTQALKPCEHKLQYIC